MNNESKSGIGTGRKVLIGCIVVLLIIIILIIGFMAYQLIRAQRQTGASSVEFEAYYVNASSSDSAVQAASETPSAEVPADLPVPTVVGDELYCDNAYMIRVSDGAVLYDKASDDQIFPASMTKIMTVITAIENAKDINMECTVTQAEIDEVYVQEASMAGFTAGETVKLTDLLYGSMLPSGGEASLAIADNIAGSSDAFVEMMNQKASEIGMTNTHFSNCTGLHQDDHYSTCKDFATLTSYAIKNPTFRQIFTTSTYTTTSSAVHPTGITLYSTLFQHLDNETLNNGAVIEGGKTGFTDQALYTLSSLCSFGGQEYILVTAHGAGIDFSHIADAKYMYGQLS